MPINSFENYPMSWKPVLPKSDTALYRLLASELEKDILEGTLLPGTKLPPQRELADYLDINLSTIVRAFKICEQKGLIYGTTGRGTFVASSITSEGILLHNIQQKKYIEMGAIIPSNEPTHILLSAMQKILQDPSATHFFQYERSDDNLFQKKAAAKWLQLSHLSVSPENILFSAGGQNAITIILASLFRRGDKIGTNSIIYPGLKTAASMLGIQLVVIPDVDGEISCDDLPFCIKKENLKGLYLISDYHNPTTHIMSRENRKALASIITKTNIIAIEDGINSLLGENPLPPIASFAPDNTIYLSSVSKTISPGLRIAFIACPPAFYSLLSIGLYNTNIMVSPFLAEVTAQLIQTEKAMQILTTRRTKTKERNQLMNTLLSDFTILGDDFCNFRWLLLPPSFTGKTFEICALNAGIRVYGAERFSVGSSPVPHAVRIAVTAESSEEYFQKGILLLKNILLTQQGFTYF